MLNEGSTLNNLFIDELIRIALNEDMAQEDITTDSLVDEDSFSRAVLISKDNGVIAGIDVAGRVFTLLDSCVVFKKYIKDGMVVKKGDILAEIEGRTRSLLKGERTALNFLQHLSGIATKTRLFCDRVKDFPVRIADTRKTTPGLRLLEKYAVRMGGGYNHRYTLMDGVLIKDNHIKASGNVKNAVESVRRRVPHTVKIEVETETLEQVKDAIESKADIIMLDNMSLEMMKEAVKLINKRALIEASGNVNLDNVYEVASVGVDIISVGELTHSVKAFDISMKFI